MKKDHSHVAKWISELALPVADHDPGDALLPAVVLATLFFQPVGVPVLLGEELAMHGDQVTRLAVAVEREIEYMQTAINTIRMEVEMASNKNMIFIYKKNHG